MKTDDMTGIQAEQQAFNKHLTEMLAAHPNKFAVFHGGKAQEFFATADEAYAWALDKFGPDEIFLVAKVAPPREGSVIARAQQHGPLICPSAAHGTVVGTIQALFKGPDMHIRLRDSVSGELVNCSFAKTLYPKIVKALEVDDSIIYVRGEIVARRADRRIQSMTALDILIAPSLSDEQYRKFFGGAPGYGGNAPAEELIRATRDRDA